MTIAIALYLFPDSEVLDFAGPYEVFTTPALELTPLAELTAAPYCEWVSLDSNHVRQLEKI